ncbi:YceI family protein, partial [candidate division KSB1 bacterium]
GQFNEFDMKVVQKNDKDFSGAEVELTIKTASINTSNEGRDKHLRSGDFFLAEKYPEITFKSTQVKKLGMDRYLVTGDLTMRGVTREVDLNAELGGIIEMGNMTAAGFHISGIVDRTEFGIKFNKALEMGGLMIGENVEIDIDLELKKSGVDQR